VFLEWWQLPGPRRFLNATLDECRRGQSVLIAVPQGAPDVATGLSRLMPEGSWEFNPRGRIMVESPSQLMESLHRAATDCSKHCREITHFSQCEGLYSRWFLLEVADRPSLAASCELLEGYAQAALGMPPHLRMRLAVVCRTSSNTGIRQSKAGVHTCRWEAVVSDLDVLLHVSFKAESPNRTLDRLKAGIVAALACGDLTLAERMIIEDTETLLNPIAWLQRYAEGMQWDRASARLDELAWFEGRAVRWKGNLVEHSASLALRGAVREILSRLWEGQLSILYPMVEKQRQRIIRRLSAGLRPTFDRDNNKTAVVDLEIAQIWRQVQARRGLGLTLDEQLSLNQLLSLRNRLAHMEPVVSEASIDALLREWDG
jgi:hypothetical protein